MRRCIHILLIWLTFLILIPSSVYSSPINLLQNNHSLLNNFLIDKDGKLYLIYDRGFYYQCNESGDAWCRITDNIRSVAIDPDDSKIFYIIRTENSVEKTMDSGKNWLKINSGLSRNISLNCIFINPHNKQEVFLGTNIGLFKTTDAGFLWQPTSLKEHVSQFLISPRDKSIFFALTPSGLYSSKDAGITWNRIDDTLPKMTIKKMGRTAEKIPIKVVGMAFVNHVKPLLLAFTAETNIKDRIIYKIFKSENNGLSWIDVSNGFNENEPPSSIYINNFDIFIGCEGCIYKSKDAISWKTIEIENEDDNYASYPQKEYNIVAQSDVKNAFAAARSFFTELKNRKGTINEAILSNYGYRKSSDVFLSIKDGTKYGLRISVSHSKGNVTYTIDNNGSITETLISNRKITGIYQVQANQGFIITDLNRRIIFVDEDSKVVGLNYGVLTHSQIVAMNNTIINGQKRIYALVRNNNYVDIDRYGLFYSTDDGKSWRKSLIYEKRESFNQRIYISPHNNEAWLFDGYRVFYTSDLLNNKWEQLKNQNYIDFDLDPMDRNIKYACIAEDLNSNLYKYKYNEESKQGGWTKLKNEVRSLLISKDDNKKLLTDKLDLSLDGGWTWKNIFSKNLLKDCPESPESYDSYYCKYYPLYFYSTNIMLFVTKDLAWTRFISFHSYLFKSKRV